MTEIYHAVTILQINVGLPMPPEIAYIRAHQIETPKFPARPSHVRREIDPSDAPIAAGRLPSQLEWGSRPTHRRLLRGEGVISSQYQALSMSFCRIQPPWL